MRRPFPMADWLDARLPAGQCIIRHGSRALTRQMLRQKVMSLATHIAARPEQRWALCFDDSGAFLIALLATLHAGRTPVIPGNLRQAALREQSGFFEAMLSDRTELQAEFDAAGTDVADTETAAAQGTMPDLPPLPPEACLELFTSGSTGNPRRVIKTISVMDCEAAWLADQFGDVLSGCEVVASVTHQHLYGLTFRIFLPMALGLPLAAGQLQFPEQLSALGSGRLLALISSPAFLKRLDVSLPAPVLQWVLSAGGVLESSDARDAARWLGVAPHEIYGSTETGVLAWRQHEQADPCWQAFPAVQFYALPDGWRVASPLIAVPDGLILEDMLEFQANGRFGLLGRRDRIVKIEEKRVSLDEVEARVLALDGVQDAAAVCLERRGQQRIGVVLTLTDASGACEFDSGVGQQSVWRQQLRQWLEPVAIPRYWRVVPSIPCNSMGKRVQAQLQELFA